MPGAGTSVEHSLGADGQFMFDPPISVISLNQCDFTSHLDLPVPADPGGEFVGVGLVGG